MKKNLGLICYLSVFLLVELIFGYFILETRSIFLEKTEQTGEYLAQSYVEKIETQLEEYVFSVELAGKYLKEMHDSWAPKAEMQHWLKSYCDKIVEKFGDNMLDFYAVVNGTLVPANPWQGDAEYEYGTKSWYYEAVQAEAGAIVFSDIYRDVVTGRNVFTISHSFASADDVIAMDIYLSSNNWMGFTDLPDGYGLFVYDSHKNLAYSMGNPSLNKFPAEAYAALESAGSGLHHEKAAEEHYNLYLCALDNGWSMVMAIPDENLVSKEQMFLMNVGLWLTVLNVVIVIVFLISNELGKQKRNLDTLTGLLNKPYFVKCTRKKLKKSDGVLLMIDLDNFKALNDNYGHDCGDMVLEQVAALLTHAFRTTDYIGRFGGDEFVVFVDAPLSDGLLQEKARMLIAQIGILAQQYPLSNLSLSIGASRCIKGDKYSDVFKWADQALYTVKTSGKSGYAMHTAA